MTFGEAMDFLEKANQYGSILGLDSMRRLLNGLGNPQKRLKFVHVAGTNGKGSTAAFISAILAAAGYRVGRYISPSVFGYREKIRISGRTRMEGNGYGITDEAISESEIADCMARIKAVAVQMVFEGSPHPTVFEMETAMAMLHFTGKKCNIIVLEVGLGGRLDATNVIDTAECAVITSISMDHMHILGDTLEQIAEEKAGIIKAGIPVASYRQAEAAQKVLEAACLRENAELFTADFDDIRLEEQGIRGTVFSYGGLKNLEIRLLGDYQVKNAVTALTAVECLRRVGYEIPEEAIRNGLYRTVWRGRFEVVRTSPLFLIDGAHNEEAAATLARNIKIYFPNRRILYIIGMLADKDYDAVLSHTGPYAERIYTVTPDNPRGLRSDILADTARKYCGRVFDAGRVSEAVILALEASGKEDVIIAFGSLSYLNEVLKSLDTT